MWNVALLVGQLVSDQIVNSQLDGLFRCHAHQLGQQASVQAHKALVTDYLEAIQEIIII